MKALILKRSGTTRVIGLVELPAIVGRIFEGTVQGRTVVDVNA